MFRLFDKAGDTVAGIHIKDAELVGLMHRNRDAPDCEVGTPFNMQADHFTVVHLVDVVRCKDDDILRVGFFNHIDVLVDGIRGAFVPMFVDALLGRQDFNIFIELRAEKIPTQVQVPVQASRLVLGEYKDLAKVAVEAVGQGEIDDPVKAPKGNSGFRPVTG
ncbi:MAG: hypothetical protein RL179_1077 [Planctomycetota bacterium]